MRRIIPQSDILRQPDRHALKNALKIMEEKIITPQQPKPSVIRLVKKTVSLF